jgi:hypothetical protein
MLLLSIETGAWWWNRLYWSHSVSFWMIEFVFMNIWVGLFGLVMSCQAQPLNNVINQWLEMILPIILSITLTSHIECEITLCIGVLFLVSFPSCWTWIYFREKIDLFTSVFREACQIWTNMSVPDDRSFIAYVSQCLSQLSLLIAIKLLRETFN